MSNGRKQPHPEYVEAYEVKLDLLMPGQAPVLPLHHREGDPRRVTATVTDLERHKLYLGRLVSVEIDNGEQQKGSFEAVDGRFVLWVPRTSSVGFTQRVCTRG